MKPVRKLIRGAFSLVELLVVVAIIAVLIALLIPAVQKVRAGMARAECANNMKQIGLALRLYEGEHGYFPKPGPFTPSGFSPNLPPYGWMYDILPYVGQEALYEKGKVLGFNFWYIDPPDEKTQAIVQQTWTTIVPNFLCPSDPRGYAGGVHGVGPWMQTCAMTSYLAVRGREQSLARGGDDLLNGVMISDEAGAHNVKLSQIIDGTSSTLMVGERPPSPDNQWGWWANYDGHSLLFAIGSQFPSDVSGIQCPDRSYFSEGDLINYCHTNHFWSFHSGGGNWLMCDGSVHFMAYSAGTTVIPPMATIAGGEEVVAPFD